MQFELKNWETSFANSLAESANDVRIVRWLNDGFPHPYTLQNAEQFIANALSEGAYHRAIISDGKVIGGISAVQKCGAMRFCADLGYWLAPDFWSRGIMTAAVGLFCREFFHRQTSTASKRSYLFRMLRPAVFWKSAGFARKAFCGKASLKTDSFTMRRFTACLRRKGERYENCSGQ